MNATARILAVDKLNKGASNGIKEAVKAKVLDTKYSTLCRDKLVAHLKSLRVDVTAIFRAAPPISSVRHVSAASEVSVGDFFEVYADRTPGWKSEGGVAMVIAVANDFSDVK
jgi:hypothetical protein